MDVTITNSQFYKIAFIAKEFRTFKVGLSKNDVLFLFDCRPKQCSKDADITVSDVEERVALRPDDTCDVTDVERSKLQTFVAHLTESLDVAVLKNPVFVIYAFSCILCMAGRSTGASS